MIADRGGDAQDLDGHGKEPRLQVVRHQANRPQVRPRRELKPDASSEPVGWAGRGAAAGLLGGCDAPGRLASLPARLHGQASFHGMPVGTRIVLDGSDEVLLGQVAAEALERELAWAMREGRSDIGPANFLAISGGGAKRRIRRRTARSLERTGHAAGIQGRHRRRRRGF